MENPDSEALEAAPKRLSFPRWESSHHPQEDSSCIDGRKQFFFWLNLNYLLNKHEQVQEMLSKKFGGIQVTQGLDMIQPLHRQISRKQDAGRSQSAWDSSLQQETKEKSSSLQLTINKPQQPQI